MENPLTNNNKFSDLVIKNTELWWEWNEKYKKINDSSIDWKEKSEYCSRCEQINEEINAIIEKMDSFFEK